MSDASDDISQVNMLDLKREIASLYNQIEIVRNLFTAVTGEEWPEIAEAEALRSENAGLRRLVNSLTKERAGQ